MAKKNHEEAAQGITRRDVIKGVSAGAAGLALMHEGVARSGESPGVESAPEPLAGDINTDSEGHDSQPSADDGEEVLGFISPTYAIRFRIPRA
jgi:hypothetical protein